MAPQDFPPSPKDLKTRLLNGRWVVSAAELDGAEADSPQFLSAILRSNEGQESFRIGARLRQPLR